MTLDCDEAARAAGPFLLRALRGVRAPAKAGYSNLGALTARRRPRVLRRLFLRRVQRDDRGHGRRRRRGAQGRECMQLWCNGCTCSSQSQLLCGHILWLRIYHVLELARAELWHNPEERLNNGFRL